MPVQYSNELQESFLGDMVKGYDGAIQVTKNNIEAVMQIIQNIIKASYYEWGYGEWGANLDEYIGQRNSRETAELMKERIINSILSQDIVSSELLEVDVVPISQDSVSLFISVAGISLVEGVLFSYKNGFELVG